MTMTTADDYCGRCGACCAAFRVDFHVSELAGNMSAVSAVPITPGALGSVPDALAVAVTATTMRMRGTDAAPPRCAALQGEIGVAVQCAIYASRPSPCRDFAPYAALGIGDDACARARRRHGLDAL